MPTTTTNYNLNKPLVNDPIDEDLWGSYINGNMDEIDTQLKANSDAVAALITVPVGTVLDYGGSSAPANYFLCYGQAVSRTTYAALFAVTGTTYGAGDGSTTFNIPDCRGRVSAGQDDMGGTSANRLTGLSGGIDGDTLGATGGAESHTLTESELAAHIHTADNLILIDPVQVGVGGYKAFVAAGGGGETETMTSTGSSAAHNNIQPTIIFNKIIRYQ